MSPRALEDSVRPRRLSGAVVRPLNFTVRAHARAPCAYAMFGTPTAKFLGKMSLHFAAAVMLLALCVPLGGCYHLPVSIDGKVVTDDGKLIRGGTVAISELRGVVGVEPTERVLGLWVTDRDGRFHASLHNVGGPLMVELIHEHCDWYASTALLSVDQLRKSSTQQVTVVTKREVCPEWLQPFSGQ